MATVAYPTVHRSTDQPREAEHLAALTPAQAAAAWAMLTRMAPDNVKGLIGMITKRVLSADKTDTKT